MSDQQQSITVEKALEAAQKELTEGRYPTAEQIYRKIVEAQPNNALAYHKLGLIAHKTGNNEIATSLIYQSTVLNPSSFQAFFDLGLAFQELRKFEDAIVSYQKALTLHPNYAEAYNNMGVSHRELGQRGKAVECCRNAIAIQPGFAPAHSNLGLALQEMGDFEAAVNSLQKGLGINPNSASMHYNLGVTFQALIKLPEAIESYKKALSIKPDLAEAHINLGLSLRDLGKFDEALCSYNDALAINPKFPEARYNLGLLQLLVGNYRDGWENYKWRWETRPRNLHPSAAEKPLWDGNNLANKKIYISTEQGFGDAIQFVRYLPILKQYGCKTILESPQPLIRLFQHSGIADEFVVPGETPPPFDCHCALLDLPRLMNTTLETIPTSKSYLEVSYNLKKKWEDRLGPKQNFRVGIVWAGNPEQTNDRYRSVDASLFLPITKIPSVSVFSLQVGKEATGLHKCDKSVVDLSPFLTDFADTAAAISHLDLIISVDTSVAHLAGSLGRPVWVPLHIISHWIYMQEDDVCPWYPTMQLFRQEKFGNWESVFAKLYHSFLCRLETTSVPIRRS